ncbi:hypothetical protein QCA50_000443 [Cerrena zonata]|uniref:Uncharacterized protein n=1 Tax=Cerrena zonata TaxID=2478898 RepID=A0AAW0GRD1_9APHY
MPVLREIDMDALFEPQPIWRIKLRKGVRKLAVKARYWGSPDIFPLYKHVFYPPPEELEQRRARKIKPAYWFRIWDRDGHRYSVIRYQRPLAGTIRVMWYPSVNSLNMESHLQSIFPLEPDGSFDLSRVMKAWNMVNCIPIDCLRGRLVPTKDPNKMSVLALTLLLDADDCLRVAEEPPEPLKIIRQFRKDVISEFRYRRWQLKYETGPYLKESYKWWRKDPIPNSIYIFWMVLGWVYFVVGWTLVPLWYPKQFYRLLSLPFQKRIDTSPVLEDFYKVPATNQTHFPMFVNLYPTYQREGGWFIMFLIMMLCTPFILFMLYY